MPARRHDLACHLVDGLIHPKRPTRPPRHQQHGPAGAQTKMAPRSAFLLLSIQSHDGLPERHTDDRPVGERSGGKTHPHDRAQPGAQPIGKARHGVCLVNHEGNSCQTRREIRRGRGIAAKSDQHIDAVAFQGEISSPHRSEEAKRKYDSGGVQCPGKREFGNAVNHRQ